MVFFLALCACSGSSKRPVALPVVEQESREDTGIDELRHDLESTVLENYNQLSLGNIEAYRDGIASDREIVMVGVTPRDLVLGKDPKGLSRDRRLYRQREPKLLSKNLDVHLSADASVGWVFDELSVRVQYLDREASIPVRATSVYVRDVERWLLVAEHLSYAIALDELVTLAARDELSQVAGMKSKRAQDHELSATLIGLVGHLHNGGSDEGVFEESERSLLLLPDPDMEFHGDRARSVAPLAELIGPGTMVGVRDFRITVGANQQNAWMVANLLVKTAKNGEPLEVGLRGSYVFAKRNEDDWIIVQAHVSAPLREEQISERVFGPIEDL